MFGFDKKVKHLTQELEQRDKVIQALREEIQDLRQNRLTQQEQEIRDSEFSVDWQRMRAFSIERNMHGNKPCTIIGYLKLDKDNNECVGEWFLSCNAETHRRLVKEFCEYKGA
jgi:hypothetical protein